MSAALQIKYISYLLLLLRNVNCSLFIQNGTFTLSDNKIDTKTIVNYVLEIRKIGFLIDYINQELFLMIGEK